MKIQIKPVTIRELFPRKRNLDEVGDNYVHDLRITKTTWSSYGKRYQRFPYTRNQLAENVSKKLSIPLDEVMTTYKDKIEIAYWKNLREVFIANLTDKLVPFIYGQQSEFIPNIKSGKESSDMIPKNVPSLENYDAEALYGNMAFLLHKDLYIDSNGEYIYQTDGDPYDFRFDSLWELRPDEQKKEIEDDYYSQLDLYSIRKKIDKVDLEIYDTMGNIVHSNVINLKRKYS